jgi:hypothetical protein
VVTSTVLMAVLYQSDDPSRAYYGTDTHAHPILIGVLLALVLIDRAATSSAARRRFDVIGVVALAGMLAAFAFAHDTSPRLYRGGSLGFAVCVAVVIASVMRAPRGLVGRLFAVRPFVAIGVISYGIYLWHWPVIVYATEDRTGMSGLGLQGFQVALTLAAATASYVLVERPIRQGLRTRRAWMWATDGPAYLQANPAPSNTSSTTLAPPQAGNPTHVVLVGDSLALSLGPGLDDAFAADGIRFEVAAVPGCSVLRGVTLQDDGRPFAWSRACDREITPALRTVVATDPKPDLVLWLSTWDAVDREFQGEHVALGTKHGDAVLAKEIRHQAALLTAQGARLVILSVANPVPGSQTPLPGLDQERGAGKNPPPPRGGAPPPHGRVRVVDLDPFVCPHGACTQVVDGVVLRADGSHFSREGSEVVGKELSKVLLDCWHDPTTCR